MVIKLIIPDRDYERMVKSGCRMRGSVGLISLKEADMRLYHDKPRFRTGVKFVKLQHGRATMNAQEQTARVTMMFDLTENGLKPSKQVICEATVASEFFEEVDDRNKRR